MLRYAIIHSLKGQIRTQGATGQRTNDGRTASCRQSSGCSTTIHSRPEPQTTVRRDQKVQQSTRGSPSRLRATHRPSEPPTRLLRGTVWQPSGLAFTSTRPLRGATNAVTRTRTSPIPTTTPTPGTANTATHRPFTAPPSRMLQMR